MPAATASLHLLAWVRRKGIVTADQLGRQGIHPEQVRRLVAEGRLLRLARGLYSSPSVDLGEHASLALAALAVPRGVICLQSALRFHDIGTQLPAETWVAIRRGDTVPRALPPGVRIIKVAPSAFADGQMDVEVHRIQVRVYAPGKTVADCFKFRGTVGLDAALEALREVLRLKLATVDEIWSHARICRVAKIMQPYLEATA